MPFDRIVLRDASGAARELSLVEFMALPFQTRVRAILDRALDFFAGGEPIARREALRALRDRSLR